MSYPNISQYLLITGSGPTDLQRKVVEMLKRGWQPLGGAQHYTDSIGHANIMQTMVYRDLTKEPKT